MSGMAAAHTCASRVTSLRCRYDVISGMATHRREVMSGMATHTCQMAARREDEEVACRRLGSEVGQHGADVWDHPLEAGATIRNVVAPLWLE